MNCQAVVHEISRLHAAHLGCAILVKSVLLFLPNMSNVRLTPITIAQAPQLRVERQRCPYTRVLLSTVA